MPKRGLPTSVRMRHDEHYVEALTSSAGTPIGRLVPIEQVDANPNQPRQVMGDLSELMASIAEKGIIEPIIVRQRGTRFQIIAGERRYQAAIQVGLPEIPVVIREVDDNEIIEIALVENLQRKDLTAFEEAEALQSLADRCRTPRASESVRDCAELDAIAHERRVQLTAFELGRPGECVERAHVDACGPCGIVAHALHAITENLVVVKFAERVLGALERVDVGRSAHPSRLGQ